ncbi:hypothetical protein ACP4OV_027483 [Aristida adscensionis]
MADRPPPGPRAALPRPSPAAARRGHQAAAEHPSLLQRAQAHVAGSAQLLGFLALAVTLTALLLLAGVTLAGALAALVFLSPLLLLTAPLWAPVAVVVSLTGAASLLACCVGVAAAAAGTWAHRYFTGRHLVGAHRAVEPQGDAGAASQAWGYYDYAREYGYGRHPRPHARVKDAAPGA